MAWSFIGSFGSAPSSNPQGGAFVPHTDAQNGDLVICVFYSRASTKTFSPTNLTTEIDVSTANGGHLYVGWYICTSPSDIRSWSASSVTNATGCAYAYTYRGGNTTAPFRYKASTAGGSNSNPDPPSVNSASGDMLLCGFGHMDDSGTLTQPTDFTDAGSWTSTLGTDASGGMSHYIGGGTGSAVDPSTYGGMSGAQYWYAWSASLDPTPPATLSNPGWDGGGWW